MKENSLSVTFHHTIKFKNRGEPSVHGFSLQQAIKTSLTPETNGDISPGSYIKAIFFNRYKDHLTGYQF